MLFKKIILFFLLNLVFIGAAQLVAQTQTILVTKNSDHRSRDPLGTNELRWAIDQANAYSGITIINFQIPSQSGSNTITINLTSSLPVIQKTTEIDATTQPGYQLGNPVIILNGSATKSTTAFYFNFAQKSKVKGIYIRNFYTGIRLNFSDFCEISTNIINRTSYACIIINSSSDCIIKGNYINTDNSLFDFYSATPSRNSGEGIYFNNNSKIGSCRNTIGGVGCTDKNTIAYVWSEAIDNYVGSPKLNVNNLFSRNIFIDNDKGYAPFSPILLRGANKGKRSPVINTVGCTTTGFSAANDIIELFGSSGIGSKSQPLNANEYLTTVIADRSGSWTANLNYMDYPYITATASDNSNNTSQFSTAKRIKIVPLILNFNANGSPLCIGSSIQFINTSTYCFGKYSFMWDFGDGSPASSSPVHTYASSGSYIVKLYIPAAINCQEHSILKAITISDCNAPQPCTNCIGSFAPDAGDYIISAWVKEDRALTTELTYSKPQLFIEFPNNINGGSNTSPTLGPFIGQGEIIDGWQRIEEKFTILPTATYINIKLNCTAGNCFFDDIRILPFAGSMKSYVYDPVNLRLVAELDERNYATFYEYDEEGKLIRVKKETEKGIMTIKENRNSSTKK